MLLPLTACSISLLTRYWQTFYVVYSILQISSFNIVATRMNDLFQYGHRPTRQRLGYCWCCDEVRGVYVQSVSNKNVISMSNSVISTLVRGFLKSSRCNNNTNNRPKLILQFGTVHSVWIICTTECIDKVFCKHKLFAYITCKNHKPGFLFLSLIS